MSSSYSMSTSASSSETMDMEEEEEDTWEYLGFGWLKDNDETAQRDPSESLTVNINPIHFNKFISLATSKMKTDIFKDEEVDALSDFTEREEPFDAMEVRLHFDFDYVLDIQNPSYVSSTITPYCLFTYRHEPEIDIEVYYRWEESETKDLKDEENPKQVLHLSLKQEPVPNPMGVLSSMEDSGWIYLGSKYIDGFCITNYRLKFEEGIDEFVNSFPLGRLTGRINSGKAIRVCNAFTPAKTFSGLQMKVDPPSQDARILILELGPGLKYNPDFIDEKIKVHYRWRQEFLELSMKIEPYDEEQDQDS